MEHRPAPWNLTEGAAAHRDQPRICQWTDRLPENLREESDKFLANAAAGGLGLADLSATAARPNATTTAWNKDKTKVLHSHGPPVRPG